MPREIRSRRCCDSDDIDGRRPIVSSEREHRDLPARGEIDVLVVEVSSMIAKYQYSATVISIYDGDTITVMVDLGFGSHTKQKLRLARINTPEVRGPQREQGIAARDYLIALMPAGSEIDVRTIKDSQEKYGRYLAEVFKDDICVNDLLVQAGMAAYKSY
jgi:micrococcal nuclease